MSNDNVIPINKNSAQYFPSSETLMMLQIIETDIKQWASGDRSEDDLEFIYCYMQEIISDLYEGP